MHLSQDMVNSLTDKFAELGQLRKENKQLKKQIEALKQRIENHAFCPDCRDKLNGKTCWRCEAQRWKNAYSNKGCGY